MPAASAGVLQPRPERSWEKLQSRRTRYAMAAAAFAETNRAAHMRLPSSRFKDSVMLFMLPSR